VIDLTLDAIMEHLAQHFRPDTNEIAERFKFFKRNQNERVGYGVYERIAQTGEIMQFWTLPGDSTSRSIHVRLTGPKVPKRVTMRIRIDSKNGFEESQSGRSGTEGDRRDASN